MMENQNAQTNTSESPAGIHVDADWKSQAEREKEELAKKVGDATPPQTAPAGDVATPAGQSADDSVAPKRGTLPSASFELLVEQYATQILMALGQLPDGSRKNRDRDMDLARLYIDLLGIIQEKSKGNLSPQQQELIDGMLYQMRMIFVAAGRK